MKKLFYEYDPGTPSMLSYSNENPLRPFSILDAEIPRQRDTIEEYLSMARMRPASSYINEKLIKWSSNNEEDLDDVIL